MKYDKNPFTNFSLQNTWEFLFLKESYFSSEKCYNPLEDFIRFMNDFFLQFYRIHFNFYTRQRGGNNGGTEQLFNKVRYKKIRKYI